MLEANKKTGEVVKLFWSAPNVGRLSCAVPEGTESWNGS